MSSGKTRVVWIDQLRGFAFFCVLFSHLNTYSQIKQVIGSFHMPLFFIISGLLLNPERILQKKLGPQILHKTQALGIPYLWTCFTLFPFWVITYKILGNTKVSLVHVVKGIFISQNLWYTAPANPVWFIGALFFATLYVYVIIKITGTHKAIRFILMAVLMAAGFVCRDLVMPWHINTAMVGAGYIYIGYLIRTYLLERTEKMEKNRQILVLSLLIAGMFFSYTNTPAIMVTGGYGRAYLFLGSSVLISLALILMFQKAQEDRFMVFMGQNTLFILGAHISIIRLMEKIFPYTMQANNRCVLLSILMFFLLAGISYVMNRYWPYVNGKFSTFTGTVREYVLRYLMVVWCAMIPVYIVLKKIGVLAAGTGIPVQAVILGVCVLLASALFLLVTSRWCPWIYLSRRMPPASANGE